MAEVASSTNNYSAHFPRAAAPLARPLSQPTMATRSHGDEAAARPAPLMPTAQHDDDIAPSKMARKFRASSIDTDEANTSRFQELSLKTPLSGRSFSGGEGSRELICLCTKAPKVPRPRNAFILYRQHHQGPVSARHPGLANPEISKLIGEHWRAEPEEVKNSWKRLAEEEKLRHQRQYPDYRYQPRRGGKGPSGKPSPSNGEDPGRCPKCGGRNIATPRTPLTPYTGAATPLTSKNGMSPFITPNPRVIETEHMRRGSSAGIMSVDGHGRRYTQPHLREIEEEYQPMSPAGTDLKRRRLNGSDAYPTSPPIRYVLPADPRYHRASISQAGPLLGPGFGPGPLPRPPGSQQYRQASEASMQPPPRPSISYRAGQTPSRPGFDESLRLPPLQTRLPSSPSMTSEPGSAHPASAAANAHTTGLGIMNSHGSGSRQQGSSKPHYLTQLNILRAIAPPLKPPGATAAPYETRGPIIAIEGFSPPVLKDVTEVVEKALSISGECVVKIWEDDERRKSPDISETKDTYTNPIAKYVSKMLKWHRTSQDLIKYITHNPARKDSDTTSTKSASPDAMDTTPDVHAQLPVAVISNGYSYTWTEREAASLPIPDEYSVADHWRWVATLWRGIVGPDLTIYVKTSSEEEVKSSNSVEFASPAVMVLRVVDGKGLDEKSERRLGFEIMEWVRNGSFKSAAKRT